MKAYIELHQRGCLTIEQDLPAVVGDCEFGIKINPDGRVWICIDGKAYLRFKPERREHKNRKDLKKAKEMLLQLTYNELGLLKEDLEDEMRERVYTEEGEEHDPAGEFLDTLRKVNF